MKRSESLVVGWVSLPVILSALSMFGFVCGVTIGKWHAPMALALSLVLTGCLVERGKWKAVLLLLAGILASIVLAGLFVYYTNADASAYHRPAAVLLANGWNPMQVTEVDALKGMMGGGFRSWHVCFLPRMGWIFGAAFYKWFGFIEVADAVNMLMLLASFVAVRDWLSGIGIRSWLWTTLVCISPVVASGLWGGSFDSAVYSAFLVAAAAASGRNGLTLALGVLAMSGLKFTGVVLGALLFAYASLLILTENESIQEKRRRLWKLAVVGMVAVAAIFLTNASPYLTSFKNHGGPFYPSHSFVASERFEDAKNPITYDFGMMNDDARQLGYFGRLVWAYGSQSLCKAYYRWKLNRSDFNPVFDVCDVGGFGSFFRLAFWVSLMFMFVIQDKRITFLMGTILLSVLIQPTFYSGYARYVPQFYLFPVLAIMGIGRRHLFRRVGVALIAVGCGYAVVLFGGTLLQCVSWQWLVSVQNLQIFEAAQKSRGKVVVSGRFAARHTFENDLNCKEVEIHTDKLCEPFDCAYSDTYRCRIPGGVPGLYVTGPSSLRKSKIRYFLFRDFFPAEIVRIPLRLWQVVRFRITQFRGF